LLCGEEGFEEGGGVCFVSGEEVSVAVEGGGDGGVAHVGGEGFGVDPGCDHEGGVAVAAFVEGEWCESGVGPVCFGAVEDGGGVERSPVAVGEDVSNVGVSLTELVGDEVASECGGEGDASFAGSAFGGDGSFADVPGAVDVDESGFQVDVGPGECLEFASAESGVEGGCPECLVCFGEGVDEERRLTGVSEQQDESVGQHRWSLVKAS
jgi:hypothetical protein